MPVGDDLDFQTRYRLLRSTSSNSRFRTHAALEQRTGRAVMVHMVDAADPETIERIREQVRSLPPEEARHVLELTALPSGFAVVTEFLQGLAFFSEWLDEKSPARPVPRAEQTRANAEPDRANEPAAFAPTVIIQSPVAPPKPATDSASSSAPTIVRPAVKTPAAAPPAPPSPVMATPAPVAPIPAPLTPEPPAPAPPAPEPRSPVATPSTSNAEPPGPGEYTRIFKMGGSPAADARAPKQPPPSVPVTPPSQALFPMSTAATDPSPASPAPHAATPDLSAPSSPPPAPQIPEAKPGEYTRIFGAKSAPPPRTPQQSSPSPFGGGGNPATPPAGERAPGGGATSTFGAWGAPSPAPSSDFGFGRSDAGSKLPPSSFPPLPPSPPTPSILAPSIPAAPSTPPGPSIPSTPFGAGAAPPAGLSPLLQSSSPGLPAPPSPSPLSGRMEDPVQRSTPGLSPLAAIQPPVFGGGLPPLQGPGDSLDSPFAQRDASKRAGGYTQINKSVTPAPPPVVAAPAKVVTSKREGFRAPTALVIVIAVVVVLAITLILYFALRAPVRPLAVPAATGAASAAPAPASPQATPATTPTSAPTTPPQKSP
jgi:hypothetical protein